MPFDFEPEVIIPRHPYDAARVFLGVLAYPERGAGLPGGAGSEFAGSLGRYLNWSTRKQKGLAQLRASAGDPDYQPPQWAQFRGRMNRGLKRIQRRGAAYSLFGTRLLNAFLKIRAAGAKAIAEDRREQAFEIRPDGQLGVAQPHLWESAFPSARQVISRDLDEWAERFSLNLTGRPADDRQKAKDLDRRAIAQSMPVLHMAHAFDEACREVGPKIGEWERRDPALALLLNAEMWIDKAMESAEQWREMSGVPMMPDVAPETLIKLEREKAG